MLELIALVITVIVVFIGHVQSRRFVRNRLRYTRFVDRPLGLGTLAGVGAALLLAPLAAVIPLIGAGTALLFGAGVGTGAALGARDTRVRVA